MLRRLGRVGPAAAVVASAAAVSVCSGGCNPAFSEMRRHKSDAYEGSLHRLDPERERGRSLKPGRVGRLFAPTQTHVVRIVLTGGPCAGKSSGLAHLTEAATREGFDVYAAPETATLLMNCGFSFPTDPTDPHFEARLLAFQKALFKLQLQIERSMTSVAASTGRPSIIMFDRGLLDGKGYMDAATWAKVLDSVDEGRGVCEDYIRSRYDGVLHLVTAADGAAPFYRYGSVNDDEGGAVFRKETPDQAVALDRTMQSCWSGHVNHVVVKNNGTFHDKLAVATDAVLTVARKTHPQEWERAVQQQETAVRQAC